MEKIVQDAEVVKRTGDNGHPKYRIDEIPASAIVIHCGDPRFQKAFHSFLTEELKLENYIPIVIGGGIHSFGSSTFLPKNFKVLWEQIKFFVKEKGVKRIVIINHADCQWYQKLQGFALKIPLAEKLRSDLKSAASIISEDFLGVGVDTYYADLKGKDIIFEEVK